MISELRERLEQVARRFRQLRLLWGVAACWLVMAVLAASYAYWISRQDRERIPASFLTAMGAITFGVSSAFGACFARKSARDTRWVARRIEAKYPNLEAGLLTAVDQIEGRAGSRRAGGYLESTVIREAVAHSRSHDWSEAVPTRSLRLGRIANAAALVLLFVTVGALRNQIQKAGSRTNSANFAQPGPMIVKVDPGHTEIEKGSPLLVVARFEGAVPPEANLVLGDGRSGYGAVRAMTRSLEDPTFAARVESVDEDVSYRVDFAGKSSETYRIKVFEYPALRRADARMVYPQYTTLDVKVVEDVRHVTLVEGTELTLTCHLNKPVDAARLADPEGNPIVLNPNPEAGPNIYQATFRPMESKKFRVQLADHDGRSNKQAYEIAVHVTRNNPPIVKTIQPSRDVRVSPVEELVLKAQIDDDFGIMRQGLSYAIGGGEPREIELKGEEVEGRKSSGKSVGPTSKKVPPKNRRLRAEHLLDFEAMKAVPDQLVTYFFWAEDVGPDGKPRRTDGDMFFAEVRHFEEIFRQGEAPSASAEMEMQGQPGQNAQQSDKLAELQKEIINGTWKLIRRETGAKPSEAHGADAKVLQEAQQSAIEQAGALAERLRDEKSKVSLELAVKSMSEAEKQLAEAARRASTTALRPALAAEQLAYQALLKLRAREFEVIRGNRRQRGGGGGGGGASQRQLNQLDLNDEQNKYEEQRAARVGQENLTKQQQEQRETRQVLSRLRELAQRQGDLNDRLKELQSALEAAKDQEAKAEIERRLKRLREQQQEILRDTDELRERMENEQNRERMAEARNEIEEGREHVRQAAEALEKGSVPQAITEGTRAGRKLNELKEEMRKETANKFSEQLTGMRDQAKRLDENQTKLTERLEAQEKTARRSLRDTDDRKQTRQDLERQGKQLDQVLNRMQETVTEAEETEPRLAEDLFDTVRKVNERMVPELIKETDRLVDLGIDEEAAKSSRRAGEGIGEMREGIERAARSVLGDEAAALRLAQQELKDLADQVDREIAQGTGKPAQPQDQNRPGQPGRDQPQEEDQHGQGGQGDRQEQARGQEGRGLTPPVRQEGQDRRGGGSLRGGGSGDGRDPRRAIDQLVDGFNSSGPGPRGPGGPITGEGFRQWTDRMRDVEELIEDADLRAEAARIRDRVRGTREDYKRHSKVPDWSKLRDLVANPMNELRKRIAEEVRRRESPDALVPIDRDPVPPQFAEGVRRYYERLGSGQ